MNNSIDQQFVEFIVKSLVSKPDAVQVTRRIDEKGVLLELTVDPEDLGRVIGKRGATAQSIRTLLRALGTKNDARYNLKIVDNGEDGHYRAPAQSEDRLAVETDNSSDEGPAPVEEVAMTPKDEEPEAIPPAETGGDRLEQTRKELQELDDLDV